MMMQMKVMDGSRIVIVFMDRSRVLHIYMCKGDFIEVRRDWIQLRNCTLYCSTGMDQRLKEKDLKGFLASCGSAGQLCFLLTS